MFSVYRTVVAALLVSTGLVSGVVPKAAAGDAEDGAGYRGNWAFGVTAGTLGIGPEIAVLLHPNFVVRANATWLEAPLPTVTFGAGDQQEEYQTDSVSMMSAGILIDWHPFRDGGRFSAGVRYHDHEITGVRTQGPGGIEETNSPFGFTAVNSSKVLPYLGFGYDSAFFKDYGLSVSTDFGVMFGMSHDVDVTPATNRTEIEDDFNSISVFPVIQLSTKYRF